MSGTLALLGGGEWHDDCRELDRELLAASGGADVLVLPTAAAYESPQRLVDRARAHFEQLSATVRTLDLFRRPDAESAENAAALREARFVYLSGGSPLHLRSVLKDSPVWDALVQAWNSGSVVAGAGAGAMVLCDPMVDPRGGAFTLGLGLVNQLAIVPHADTWSDEKTSRTIALADRDVVVAELTRGTALVRDGDGKWTAIGSGKATLWRSGEQVDVSALG